MIVARLISSGSFGPRADYLDATQWQPSVPNGPKTCMLVFSIVVGYKLRAAAELCLEIMVQNDIEY